MKEHSNKFKVGDKAYTARANNNLVVIIQEVLIYGVENKKDYEWYSGIGLSHNIINDYEISDKETLADEWHKEQDKNSLKPYLTTSTRGEFIYSKEELDDAILEAVERKKNHIKIALEGADRFRCPLTGGRMIRVRNRMDIMDGPTQYRVEGQKIIWEVWPRDWEPRPYHTTYKGKKYSFERLDDDTWREVILITGANGRGMYVDKKLYKSKDPDTTKKVEEFLEEQKRAKEEWDRENKEAKSTGIEFPKMTQIFAKTLGTELVEVRPMSPPLGFCPYFEVGEKYKLEIDGFEVVVSDTVFKMLNLNPIDGVCTLGSSKIRIL